MLKMRLKFVGLEQADVTLRDSGEIRTYYTVTALDDQDEMISFNAPKAFAAAVRSLPPLTDIECSVAFVKPEGQRRHQLSLTEVVRLPASKAA